MQPQNLWRLLCETDADLTAYLRAHGVKEKTLTVCADYDRFLALCTLCEEDENERERLSILLSSLGIALAPSRANASAVWRDSLPFFEKTGARVQISPVPAREQSAFIPHWQGESADAFWEAEKVLPALPTESLEVFTACLGEIVRSEGEGVLCPGEWLADFERPNPFSAGMAFRFFAEGRVEGCELFTSQILRILAKACADARLPLGFACTRIPCAERLDAFFSYMTREGFLPRTVFFAPNAEPLARFAAAYGNHLDDGLPAVLIGSV